MKLNISVIIPCYNNSDTIARAITSVLNQTVAATEIIIVDDGSSDVNQTQDIIQQLDDRRIKLIKHQQNKNGSAARNTGIKAATGDIIALLDADDEWLPNHLEHSINRLLNNDIELCYCKAQIKTNKIIDLTLPSNAIKHNETVADYLFLKNGFIQTSTLVFKKEKVQVLFNEHLIRHQDYDFLLQVEAAGHKIGMSPHTGAIIHWENNNPAAKGGTWDYSLKWAKNNKGLLGTKAFANFLHKHCITPLLVQKKRTKALNLFFTNAVFLYLPLKQWAFFISYLIWGRVVFSRIKK